MPSIVALVAARETKAIAGDIARHTKQIIDSGKHDDGLMREYLMTDIFEMRSALDHIEREFGIQQSGS